MTDTSAPGAPRSATAAPPSATAGRFLHSLTPMRSRDPHEEHRVATTLELLYDLTLVIAFGVSGVQMAHALASGHVAAGLAAFGFVQFSTIWAWMSYSGFASAYDTDDWGVRMGVAVQMVGVIMMTTGIPALYEGFEHGWQLHSGTMVAGYVVMRVSLVALWLRAARANPDQARACRIHALWIALARHCGSAPPSSTTSPHWDSSWCRCRYSPWSWESRPTSCAATTTWAGTRTTWPSASAC